MERINLGRIEIVARAISPDRRGSSDPPQHIRVPTRIVSLEEARELAGFRIWQPRNLPLPGLELAHVQLVVADSSGPVIGTILKYRESSNRWMVVEQRLIAAVHGAKVTIPFIMWEGEVGDRPAAFFTHTVGAQNQPDGQISILHCLWEHHDSLMELQGPWLSPEEMAQIGESLG